MTTKCFFTVKLLLCCDSTHYLLYTSFTDARSLCVQGIVGSMRLHGKEVRAERLSAPGLAQRKHRPWVLLRLLSVYPPHFSQHEPHAHAPYAFTQTARLALAIEPVV